jgi:hypothetical protein
MRVWIWAALLLAGCAMPTKDAPMADALRISGSWIGLDDAGEHWWRLELGEGRAGRGAFESNGAVARYSITDWTSEANGAVNVHLVRGDDATVLDAAPRMIRLSGKCDGVWLRLMLGKSEVVFLREDRLIGARDRLRKGMEAK